MAVTVIWLVLVGVLVLAAPSSPYTSTHCYFNPLCSCKQQAGQAATAGSSGGLMQVYLLANIYHIYL